MNKKPIILGIESSCDETAASIITENEQGMPTILSSIVSSQVDVHKEFGGVVPELAARSHMEKIDLITKKAFDKSGVKMEDLDAIAATAGPGLMVCLSVGLSFGKAMALMSLSHVARAQAQPRKPWARTHLCLVWARRQR